MRWLAVLVSVLMLQARVGAAEVEGLRFDPARHMRVSEVKVGMKGHGLSVFKGTKIERFDVEVLSVLKHFNPKYDVVLVQCRGQNLEHTGSIAGMSGSPIFLRDDQGRERMIGAFAYGWPMMKDPVGGVQPIEYMLDIKRQKAATKPATGTTALRAQAAGSVLWKASDSILLPGMKEPPRNFPVASINSMKPNPRLLADDDSVEKLRPLATPLMTSGLPTKVLAEFEPLFRAYGMVPVQAGGFGGGSNSGTTQAAKDLKLEPGSVLAVPLITGDVEMTAVGTCTEVQGPFVVGFGHPFNNEGPVSLPVGTGEVNAVIANLVTSFKLGALVKSTGTLYADETVGVAGKLGDVPKTIPIDVNVQYTDGSGEKSYGFQGAWHRKFTPLLSTAAVLAAVSGVHDLPEHHTIRYDLTVEFDNDQKVAINNTDVDAGAAALFMAIGSPMIAASDNPFAEVAVKKISGTVKITPEAQSGEILWVNAQKLKYRPGETLKAFLNYRPFRGTETILPIEFELPHDLEDGKYQFSIAGHAQYLSDEQASKPFRFSAENAKEMFAVLREISAVRHDALYMRLVRQPDGVAIGRTAMPNLPSSRRQVIMGAGRSNTTAYVSSVTKSVPMDLVMEGNAALELTIEREDRVESPGGKINKKENAVLPKLDEPKAANRAKTEIPVAPAPTPSPAPSPTPEP
ncbi:MAG TPA: hypothetical protein VF669_19200 [Tepidisphaeraceae bacterium]|jgi:hypothetical protein